MVGRRGTVRHWVSAIAAQLPNRIQSEGCWGLVLWLVVVGFQVLFLCCWGGHGAYVHRPIGETTSSLFAVMVLYCARNGRTVVEKNVSRITFVVLFGNRLKNRFNRYQHSLIIIMICEGWMEASLQTVVDSVWPDFVRSDLSDVDTCVHKCYRRIFEISLIFPSDKHFDNEPTGWKDFNLFGSLATYNHRFQIHLK